MIDITRHVPADYFISVRGRQADPAGEYKTKECIYYVGWEQDAYDRDKQQLIFTTKFGKSANFETAEDAYRMIFDPQFREAFQSTIENDVSFSFENENLDLKSKSIILICPQRQPVLWSYIPLVLFPLLLERF